jgi:hypothetical protein
VARSSEGLSALSIPHRRGEEAIDTENPWDAQDGDELEAEIMRADRKFGVDRRGTTLDEALDGPTLDQALARERAEGRTVDEILTLVDDGVPDLVSELVTEARFVADDFPSAEESALSIRKRAPGGH